MPMWKCDVPDCERPGVRLTGDCILCKRHLCSEHQNPAFHQCPSWSDAEAYDALAPTAEDAEISDLLSRIDLPALCSAASRLRQGQQCSISTDPRVLQKGGMNIHLELCFEDGVVWLARIRRFNVTSPPPEWGDYTLKSEVATLKFLEKLQIPTPKVFGFGLRTDIDNSTGVSYVFYEKMKGSHLNLSSATAAQRAKIIGQMADHMIELRNQPFDRIGSLDQPGDAHIGVFAREAWIDFPDSTACPLGPFDNLKDCYAAYLEMTCEQIVRKEIYADHPVDALLIHLYLLEAIEICLSPDRPTEGFFLKHADDKGEHILVDEEYNITAVLDWEWAYTTTASEAFAAPTMFIPAGDFYDGVVSIGNDEEALANTLDDKGAPELADHVRNGRWRNQFDFLCSHKTWLDWDAFVGLFVGFLRSAPGVPGVDVEDWRSQLLERYRDDEVLGVVLRSSIASAALWLDIHLLLISPKS